jgi:hypothetical protein
LNILREKFGINLEFKPDNCIFSGLNPKCELEKCLFY